jgi:hypothetical protein
VRTYVHLRMYIYDNISLNSSQNEKCFRRKLYIKTKHNSLFFSENRAVYGIMWKKRGTVIEATDENTAFAHCMLDT